MRFGGAETGEQQGGGVRFHRRAAIGVQGELAGRDVLFEHGVVDQRLEQRGGFGVRDRPADNPSVENIEDDA